MTFIEAFQKSLDTGCVIRLDGDPWLWRAAAGNRLVSVDRVGVKDAMTVFASLSEWSVVEVSDLEQRLASLDEERKANKRAYLAGLKDAADLLRLRGQHAPVAPHQGEKIRDLKEWSLGYAQALCEDEKLIREKIEKETMPSIQMAK